MSAAVRRFELSPLAAASILLLSPPRGTPTPLTRPDASVQEGAWLYHLFFQLEMLVGHVTDLCVPLCVGFAEYLPRS